MIGFVGAFLPIFNIKLLWSEFCYVSLLLFSAVFIYLYPFLFSYSWTAVHLIYNNIIINAIEN